MPRQRNAATRLRPDGRFGRLPERLASMVRKGYIARLAGSDLQHARRNSAGTVYRADRADVSRGFRDDASAMTSPVICIKGLGKTYAGGFKALASIDLDIERGEIFALLGPNGAGKTTLISIVCGIVNPTAGRVLVAGHDIVKDFRQSRSLIGLVPQELTTDTFETVLNTVTFSRGLFGKPPDPGHIESVLRSLSLWDKRDNIIMTLSGGMKRRVLIAKALAHEPQILFLDEPTAGVDVELRQGMWDVVRKLQESGVTIILTTHYIEEAEQMADRIGVINHGELVLVQDKKRLMQELGSKQLHLQLSAALPSLPASLGDYPVSVSADGLTLTFSYDTQAKNTGITEFLDKLAQENIHFNDLNTEQNSLEDIFVDLVRRRGS